MRSSIPVLLLIVLLSCGSTGQHENALQYQGPRPDSAITSAEFFDTTLAYAWMKSPDTVNTLCRRIPVPEGFTRIPAENGSYASWLRHLPLLKSGSPVMLYNGEEKNNQRAHHAVLNIDVGTRDLQQCADAVMRLRAEYLFSKKDWEQLHFNYTSGDKIDFKRWSEGKRPVVSGNKVSWNGSGKSGKEHANFRDYMNNVFQYAGSKSLSGELKPVKNEDMKPGDVFILGGFPGHAVTVLDMAVNPKTGKKIFLLCQSYMPAQQIHVLKNPNSPAISPWYSLDFTGDLETPEWTFAPNSLKRF
ncbi:MAG: hypothetical protein FD123_4276 [Bacteroidetes bacterium]|nr:MAG: hypothetical protein FD123_4276 [Bacteroidota bacterium]